jgi:hypothetical protein
VEFPGVFGEPEEPRRDLGTLFDLVAKKIPAVGGKNAVEKET